MLRWVCAVGLMLCGCRGTTELLVVLSTDVPESEYDGLSLAIGNVAGDPTLSRVYLVPGEATLPASIELHPAQGDPTSKIDVSLLAGGSTLVERRAVVPFVHGRSLLLRLELEKSCVGVSCGTDQTCIDGVCQSDTVAPATLTPIPSDPLAGVDSGSVVDLASGVADLAVAAPVDLSVAPDLSTSCPVLPPVPSPMTGCVVYLPSDPGFPNELNESVSGGTTVSLDTACSGERVISMPAGAHTLANGMAYTLLTPNEYVSGYHLAAGYWSQSVTSGEAGVIAESSGHYALFATTASATAADTDEIDYETDATTPVPLGQVAAGPHVLEVQRTVVGTSSAYTLVHPGGSVTEKSTLGTSNNVGFFVANDDAQNPSDAIVVRLAWIQICEP